MQKRALVTGGNSGIGLSTAKLLKDKGYDVCICGRNAERVAAAAQALGVEHFVADMGKASDVASLAEKFIDRPLDVLINNAGIARFIPIEYSTDEDFATFMNVNVRGPFNLIKHLLEPLKRAKGCVINVSSAVVNNGLANASLYASTKGAIDALTKSLAIELAPAGIRINAVAPGAVDTPIFSKLGMDEKTLELAKAQMLTTIPLSRYGTADELAAVILAQIESTYTTGAIWCVDGGVNAT